MKATDLKDKFFQKCAEDGLVKVKPMKLGTSLIDNIVKICAQLREDGFHRQAQRLEEKFAAYKKAETSLQTFKLMDTAHPEGSTELLKGNKESKIETKEDQNKAILRALQKKAKAMGMGVEEPEVLERAHHSLDQSEEYPVHTIEEQDEEVMEALKQNGKINKEKHAILDGINRIVAASACVGKQYIDPELLQNLNSVKKIASLNAPDNQNLLLVVALKKVDNSLKQKLASNEKDISMSWELSKTNFENMKRINSQLLNLLKKSK